MRPSPTGKTKHVMDRDYINIKTLTLEELAGVVNLYPWFGAARRELSLRMARLGGEAWGRQQYGDAAMYVVDRRVIAELLRDRGGDYSDKDLEELLRMFIRDDEASAEGEKKSVRVTGGDYFTQAQYDMVRREEDNVFSRFAAKTRKDNEGGSSDEIGDDFCTETLAQIYLDQGYPDKAKKIYSALLLKFPEKNAYFATLIRKIEESMGS